MEWSELPFTEKQEIRSAGEAARVKAHTPSQTFFTGGTTGDALAYEVSDAEQNYLKQFFGKRNANCSISRVARLWDGGQIFGRDIPTPSRFHNVSMLTPGGLTWLNSELNRCFDEAGLPDRISILAGGERALRAFALWLKANHPGAADGWALNAAIVFGTILTARGRVDLETIFSAPIIDRWGLSEAVGGATECSCGWYHPDPFLHVEAVDPFDRSLVEEGVAELVVTPLFPFQQRQPLVRYLTGDLALVTRNSTCRPREPALRPLGRLSQSARLAHRRLIPEKVIIEAVESEEAVVRRPVWLDVETIDQSWPIGRPDVSVTMNSDRPTLMIGVREGTPPAAQDDIKYRVNERLKLACGECCANLWVEMVISPCGS